MDDTMKSGSMGDEFVITRIFEAPREEVWMAWTDPERVKQWWGPQGFTAPVVNIDFSVGGRYLTDMRDPDGKDYWNAGIYREIMPPEKIVATDYFSDESGNPVPPSHYGLPGDEAVQQTVTFTFEEVEGNKTKFTVRHASSGSQEDDERTGWNQMLDKLEENLRLSKAA